MDPKLTPTDAPNTLQTDVSPLEPRPQDEVQGEDEESVTLGFPEPPPDWAFNIFLTNLSDGITDEEFHNMKHFFTGIIGTKVLEACRTATDVFKIMRQRALLNNDNLLYLQSIVHNLKRPDLLEMCIEYSRRLPNVLHFYTPAESPAEGHRFAKFHVEGKDFINCSRTYIEKLRNTVAAILFIPPQYIFIAGVEPSSSMLITLMIPEMYADALRTMLKTNTHIEELVDISVDIIGIDDEKYNIRGIEEAEIILTDQQSKLMNVFQQLRTKTEQLEEREIECLQLQRKLDTMDKRELDKDGLLMMFHRMFHAVVPQPKPATTYKPASLASQTALREFKTALKFVDDKQYDKDLILALLDANTVVIVNRLRESFHLQYERLFIEMNDLQSLVIPLTMKLEKYKFAVEFDPEQIDSIIYEKLQRSVAIRVNLSKSMHYLDAAGKISRMLRYKEKTKLKARYEWPDDPITDAITKEANLFLCCLYLKEVESTETEVDLVSFITTTLEEVGRKDLVTKFQELIKLPPTSAAGSSRSSSQKRNKGPRGKGATSPRDQDETPKKGAQGTKSSEQMSKSSRGNQQGKDKLAEVDLNSLSRQVATIQDKLDSSMCQIMECIQGKPPPYASLCPDIYPKQMYSIHARQTMQTDAV